MITTIQRKKLRKTVVAFLNKILSDPLYNTIYTISQPDWYLHCKDDHPEVRIQFFETIRRMELFECYIIIARKIPELFNNKHKGNANEFYFDILNNLLHQIPIEENKHYRLYLAKRDNPNLAAFREAVKKVTNKLTKTNKHPFCTYQCDVVTAKDCPEMSVLDYLLWAVQRYIIKKERRYLTALEGKYKLIYDIYEQEGKTKRYNSLTPFNLETASDFDIKK